jgi:uncharacterized protein with PIN domain
MRPSRSVPAIPIASRGSVRQPVRRSRGARSLYLDASCLVRLLLGEEGARAPLGRNVVAASSKVVEVECFRTLDRARLGGYLDDAETASKSLELGQLIARLHLVPVSNEVIALARATATSTAWC